MSRLYQQLLKIILQADADRKDAALKVSRGDVHKPRICINCESLPDYNSDRNIDRNTKRNPIAKTQHIAFGCSFISELSPDQARRRGEEPESAEQYRILIYDTNKNLLRIEICIVCCRELLPVIYYLTPYCGSGGNLIHEPQVRHDSIIGFSYAQADRALALVSDLRPANATYYN